MAVIFERSYGIRDRTPEGIGPMLADLRAALSGIDGDTDDLKCCLFEAATNSWRHSGGSRMTVSIEDEDRWYFCTVVDDGTGFDTEAILSKPVPDDPFSDHGRGLHIIRSLAGHFELARDGRRLRFSVDCP